MELNDWRLEYIRSKRWPLTVDEAALVTASIPPDSVFRRVWHATANFHPNRGGAAKVADALKQAVMNGELFVTGREVLGFTVEAALGNVKSPHELGKLDGTEIFQDSQKVWTWLVDKGFLPREYIESDRDSGIESPTIHTQPLTQNNESELVCELTKQLQEARKEIARLKAATSPAFLHMTPLLELVVWTQQQYWGDELKPRPKQDVIIDELMRRHGLNKTRALMVESVACPVDRDKTEKRPKPN